MWINSLKALISLDCIYFAVLIPACETKSFIYALLDSNLEAARDGPNTRTLCAIKKSLSPSLNGASGPIITSVILYFCIDSKISVCFVAGILTPSACVPPLPGAKYKPSTLLSSFSTSPIAYSRPPLPIINIFSRILFP